MDRKTAVAGGFYPSNPTKLEATVKSLMEDAGPQKTVASLKGVIVPHAGYIYSGPVAGHAYRLIRDSFSGQDQKIDVFLIGPAHHLYTTASIGNFEAFETPLGKIKVNLEICKKLSGHDIFDRSSEAHIPEHSLEVQLPFLRESLHDFEIIPIVLGDADIPALAQILQPYFGKKNSLFVVSSDLSHYLPYETAIRRDRKTLDIITRLQTDRLSELDACGASGISVTMLMSAKTGCTVELLDYRNSGDTAGDRDAVVGYAALSIS